MVKAVHSMIRVFDLDRSIDFYHKALGMTVADQFVFADFTLTYLKTEDSDFELELTFNHHQQTPYTHGTGYGHLAVTVDNIEATHDTLSRLQLQPTAIKQLALDDANHVRFFFINDPDEYKIEVIEQGARFR